MLFPHGRLGDWGILILSVGVGGLLFVRGTLHRYSCPLGPTSLVVVIFWVERWLPFPAVGEIHGEVFFGAVGVVAALSLRLWFQ